MCAAGGRIRRFTDVALIFHRVNQNCGVHKSSKFSLADRAEAPELFPGETVKIPPVHALEPILGANLFPAGSLLILAARPRATAFEADAYPDLHAKAATLVHSLARNHALVDGNVARSSRARGAYLRCSSADSGRTLPIATRRTGGAC